jgi:NAD(P)-dependent dehydrogenase (short-subunit alcohol dehydrogenase family)
MKNVIITGTSRGIGYQLAKLFANKGHQVLALSRNNLPLLDQENITALSVDLAKPESYTAIADFIKNNWKKVDIIIHNAGVLVNKPFEETTLEDFQQVYGVNVFAVAMLTQTALPYLIKKSHVLSISSMGGIQGSMKFAGLAAYSSSKGALITLSELLAEEYKERQIAFNTLALGAVQTEMLAEAFPDYQAPTSAEEMAYYIFDFALKGATYHNGKTIQVANSTP